MLRSEYGGAERSGKKQQVKSFAHLRIDSLESESYKRAYPSAKRSGQIVFRSAYYRAEGYSGKKLRRWLSCMADSLFE
ncbi:MAG: hypothetical protein OXJ53_03940, partial [Gammaproteobacteria bacterium]|nr:hypothetical protein [Gammaproteobacteria bacterium]